MKKELSLEILKALEPFVGSNGRNFTIVKSDKALMRAIDNDPKSDFHFTIQSVKYVPDTRLTVNIKPVSRASTSGKLLEVPIAKLQDKFKEWVSILDDYEKTKSFFDDPIINTYAEEYFDYFELVDEDAKTKPFDTKRIFLLDEHLTNIETLLNKGIVDKNTIQIAEIKEDIKVLRENLTAQTKDWVLKKLAVIWAKITKAGVVLTKLVLTEAVKQTVIQGVKDIFDNNIITS